MFYLEQTGTTTARTPGVHEEGIIYQSLMTMEKV